MKNVLKKGMNEQMPVGQKMPRGEVKGSQKPVAKKESVKANGKSFTIK